VLEGVGTASDCTGQQGNVSGGNGGLLNISPAVQLGVCGNGAGILRGLGTTSGCEGQQGEATGGTGALAVSPAVQAAVCGNGAAVLGIRSEERRVGKGWRSRT